MFERLRNLSTITRNARGKSTIPLRGSLTCYFQTVLFFKDTGAGEKVSEKSYT